MKKEQITIDVFSDEELRNELEFRGYNVYNEEELEEEVENIVCGEEEADGFYLKKDFLGYELRDHLLEITGQGGWVKDEDIMNKLLELIK